MKQLAFNFDAATKTMPVELLRDRRGVYGIGLSSAFVLSRTGSRRPDDEPDCDHPRGALILRPDKFEDTKPKSAVLQKITGGFRRSIFNGSIEERLRRFIHHEALERSGLPWPPVVRPGPYDTAWWSDDKKQQARNRQIYHGLRLLSLQVINRLIGQAHEEAANADAIRAARRFAFRCRENIYRAGARSRRALQLIETFPVLALILYSEFGWLNTHLSDDDWKQEVKNEAARKKAAIDLVERGARLRDVAAAMGVPMALRCIKPGAAHLAFKVYRHCPELLRFMPEALPRSKSWLRLVDWASSRGGLDFAAWAARNVPQMPGRLVEEEVVSFLSDIADWVIAGVPPKTVFCDRDGEPTPPIGREFVVRPFTPSMSIKTVTKLSADWHEAVAAGMSGPQFAFPPPWYPPAKFGAYDIIPIDDSGELYREGSTMHHCVGTYAPRVKDGHICVYSVRCEGQRLATLALARRGKEATVIQLRGPCNAPAPKAIISTVTRWLRAQAPLPPPPPPPPWGAP